MASAFELPDCQAVNVRSEELLARGPLVVSFFRGTWCGYCESNLRVSTSWPIFEQALTPFKALAGR